MPRYIIEALGTKHKGRKLERHRRILDLKHQSIGHIKVKNIFNYVWVTENIHETSWCRQRVNDKKNSNKNERMLAQ